jgi:hypothetical protein
VAWNIRNYRYVGDVSPTYFFLLHNILLEITICKRPTGETKHNIDRLLILSTKPLLARVFVGGLHDIVDGDDNRWRPQQQCCHSKPTLPGGRGGAADTAQRLSCRVPQRPNPIDIDLEAQLVA